MYMNFTNEASSQIFLHILNIYVHTQCMLQYSLELWHHSKITECRLKLFHLPISEAFAPAIGGRSAVNVTESSSRKLIRKHLCPPFWPWSTKLFSRKHFGMHILYVPVCVCVHMSVHMQEQACVHKLARWTSAPTTAAEEGGCSLQDVVGSDIVVFQQARNGSGVTTKWSESARIGLVEGEEHTAYSTSHIKRQQELTSSTTVPGPSPTWTISVSWLVKD